MRQAYNARRREAIPQPLPASGTPSLMSLAEEESPSSAHLQDSERHVVGGGGGGDSSTNPMELAEEGEVEIALALASAVTDSGEAGGAWTETQSEGEGGRDERIGRDEGNGWQDVDMDEEDAIGIHTPFESEVYVVATHEEWASSRNRPEPSTTFADFTELSSSDLEPMAIIPDDDDPVLPWPWSHLDSYSRTADDSSDDDDSSDEDDSYASSPGTLDASVKPSDPPSTAGSLRPSRQPAAGSLIVKLPSSAYKNAPQQAAVQLGGLSRLLRSNPPMPTSTSAMAAATGWPQPGLEIQDEETPSSSWETEGTLSSSWETQRDLHPHYLSTSPRTIRRQMEMSESLRQGLFPQRYFDRMENGLDVRGRRRLGAVNARR
ncbi:hypothetical protein C8F01DRAFT_1121453 [Mycena amicta]|nr:hypothetical protein C8F01DRAFT_1121453 [Mycena amicta]